MGMATAVRRNKSFGCNNKRKRKACNAKIKVNEIVFKRNALEELIQKVILFKKEMKIGDDDPEDVFVLRCAVLDYIELEERNIRESGDFPASAEKVCRLAVLDLWRSTMKVFSSQKDLLRDYKELNNSLSHAFS